MQELKHKLREQAQQLGVTEKETLARYYGNFAVRARRHRVPLGGGNVELPNFRAHYRAAMRRSCDWIVKEIENRLDHLAKRFG